LCCNWCSTTEAQWAGTCRASHSKYRHSSVTSDRSANLTGFIRVSQLGCVQRNHFLQWATRVTVATSGSEGSESASESEQSDPPSSLVSDAEQYERMQASHGTVGRDFKDQEDFIGYLSTCGFLCRREEELSAPRISLF